MTTDPTPPTAADMAIDAKRRLHETEEAIAYMRKIGMPPPNEAHEIAGILRRLVAAEADRNQLREDVELQRQQFAVLGERCEAWKELAQLRIRNTKLDRIGELRRQLGEE